MSKKQTVIRTMLFLLLLAAVSFAVYAGTSSLPRIKPAIEKGYVDMSQFNWKDNLAILSTDKFEYFPSALYTPQNIPNGFLTEDMQATETKEERYGTYRIVLKMPVGEIYGVNAYSAHHAHRMFVNGEEISVFGTPGETVNTTIPETGYYTVFFTSETEEIEIIIQNASIQYGGRGPSDLLIGTAENINNRAASVKTRIHMTEGGIITAFFLSAGLYLFFNRKMNLWFCFACVALFVRIAVMEETNMIDFLLQLSWEESVRLKCLSTIILIFCFVFYIRDFFQKVMRSTVITVFGVGSILIALIVMFTPVSVFSKVIYYSIWICWAFLIYMAVSVAVYLARNGKMLGVEHVLLLGEIVLFTICFILDIYFYKQGIYNMSMGLVDIGTVICVNINTIVPIIDYFRTSKERDKVRRAELEIRQTNQLLDRLNRVRDEFLQNLSHELKTPLTVMSNCAGLTALQIRQNAQDEETLENMNIIKQEAARLGRMVEQIKDISMDKNRHFSMKETKIQEIFQNTIDFCEPICRKNKNGLGLEVEGTSVMFVNRDSIFQVLLNLVINANRHTRRDTIILKAEKMQSGDIRIGVIDHGEGIPYDLKPHVFERHISGDGGSGLGLSICKEIVEQHGGTMNVQSKSGHGTTIYLIIPGHKEESNEYSAY